MYKRTSRWKPFLRENFRHKCAYCTIHEMEAGGPGHFQVDHFVPRRVARKIDPKKERDYHNLVYCCVECNSTKSGGYPTPAETADNRRLIDPAQETRFPIHIVESDDAKLVAISPPGKKTVEILKLDKRRQTILRGRDQKVRSHNRRMQVLYTSLKALNEGEQARYQLRRHIASKPVIDDILREMSKEQREFQEFLGLFE